MRELGMMEWHMDLEHIPRQMGRFMLETGKMIFKMVQEKKNGQMDHTTKARLRMG